MTVIKKIFLAIGGIIIIAVAILWFISPSYAAGGTTTDHRLIQVERIWKKFDPNSMLFQGGLTAIGYEVFFPGRDVREGMVQWQKMTPLARLAFLEQEGDPLSRGLWASQRNDELSADFKGKYPEMTDENIAEVIGNLGIEAVRNCLSAQPPMHPDHCIFFLARIADAKEMQSAQRDVGWYRWYLSSRSKFPPAALK
ncbi:MAG: hypothetical protein WAU28_03760 [Candidatus Moraniibacteriota bacterium]